jgi:multiple sugar transport system permease protein
MTSSSRLRSTTMRARTARREVGPSASAGAIYAGLTVGALITLAPFALGLLTSFT